MFWLNIGGFSRASRISEKPLKLNTFCDGLMTIALVSSPDHEPAASQRESGFTRYAVLVSPVDHIV